MQKIMFNDRFGLTTAVLEGQKTMTRRIVPNREIEKYYEWRDDVLSIGFGDIPVQFQSLKEAMLLKARYKVGEVVAIAQSYKDVTKGHTWAVSNADGHSVHKDVLKQSAGWENKMFVKADLMPHHIKIAYIKVERLQDISDEDCLREGICQCEACYEAILSKGGVKYAFGDCNRCFKTPREAFAALIDKISGKGTWDSNPWCFCYEFKLID